MFVQPLDKGRFVRAVVTSLCIEVQRFLTFSARQQHHFIAAAIPGNLSCIVQASRSITVSSVVTMGHHILKEGIGPHIPFQIGNDDTDAGGYNAFIYRTDNQVVALILDDLVPGFQQIGIFFRHRRFVEG